MTLASGDHRFFHGIVSRFSQFGREEKLIVYRMEIVPAFWFLTLTSDCKIFQNKSALDIVKDVLSANGVSDLEVRCNKSYPTREFCVQYRETHFDFVSRLLEEEGIFYFFDHADGKHTLVLSDDPSGAKGSVQAERRRNGRPAGAVRRATSSSSYHVTRGSHSKVALQITTSSSLFLAARGHSREQGEGRAMGRLSWRVTQVGDGERRAKIQVEATGRARARSRATELPIFVTGHKFDLGDHYRKDADGAYWLTTFSTPRALVPSHGPRRR